MRKDERYPERFTTGNDPDLAEACNRAFEGVSRDGNGLARHLDGQDAGRLQRGYTLPPRDLDEWTARNGDRYRRVEIADPGIEYADRFAVPPCERSPGVTRDQAFRAWVLIACCLLAVAAVVVAAVVGR